MVRSLPFHVRENDLKPLFEKHGTVESCKVVMDREDPTRSRGFAFITFSSESSATDAVNSLDNYRLEGRNIRVHLDEKNNSGDRRPASTGQFDHSRGSGDRKYDNRRDDNRRDDNRRDDNRRDDSRRDDNRRDDRRDGERSRRGERDRSPRRVAEGSGVEEMQDPNNMNGRIYIEGIVDGTTDEEIAAHFGMLGQVARKRQKRGYPNEWPFKVSIYRDDAGKPKGDATLSYVDPNAAQSAPAFFDNTEFKGAIIKVQMAQQKDPEESRGGASGRGSSGGRGGFRGSGRRY